MLLLLLAAILLRCLHIANIPSHRALIHDKEGRPAECNP